MTAKSKTTIEDDLMDIKMEPRIHMGHYDVWVLQDLVEYIYEYVKANEKWKKKIEEELRIVYKNGVIDGKQGTNCMKVVILECLKRLDRK